MNTFETLSVSELKRALTLREKIEKLQAELTKVLGGGTSAPAKPGKRTMSAAGRAAIAAAQKARWAKTKGKQADQPKGKRKMSAAGRAAISAAAKARWAKVKAGGKSKN